MIVRRLARLGPAVIIGVIPVVVLCGGVARFILTHFFYRAPYLLDTGMLSGVVYRSGVWLRAPRISCDFADHFYDVYVSPVASVFSVVSEVLPVERIEWFAFFQACLYLPIAIAVYVVASRIGGLRDGRRLPVTLLAALAFSYSGLVLWTVMYPHFEVAQSALTCLVIGGVVTERWRLAWVCLALAACVRQDGGTHVVMGLLPLCYVRRDRRLLRMVAAAIGLCVLSFVVQKLFFHPPARLREVYIGTPAYAHLTAELLWLRLRHFVDVCGVVWYPAVATLVVAIWRRDPRYLLGWAAALPWFLFNFTARDGGKGGIGSYVASPFIVSVFWVYVYGAVLAPTTRRLQPIVAEAILALVCLTSFAGYYRLAKTWPSEQHGWPREPLRDMVVSHPMNRDLVHRFVGSVGAHRGELGKLYVDDSVAALAFEHLQLENSWHTGIRDADTIAFHRRSWRRAEILADVRANGLTLCTLVLGTQIYLCRRETSPPLLLTGIPTVVVPVLSLR